MPRDYPASRQMLLERRARVYLPQSSGPPLPELVLQALEIELAELGYQPARALRERLSRLDAGELKEQLEWISAALTARSGADKKHIPLFRSFPEGIPADTGELWLWKVLTHFVQAEGQSCTRCGRSGTTHVLRPCMHVVCEHCYDGSSYTACPICEHRVDMSSPFFKAGDLPQAGFSGERVIFRLLEAGADLETDARELFTQFCERRQAMSAEDRASLKELATEWAAQVSGWLPGRFTVRENLALVLSILLDTLGPEQFLDLSGRYLHSATDLLRVLAVVNGAEPTLMGEQRFKESWREVPLSPLVGAIQSIFQPGAPRTQRLRVMSRQRVYRFKVAPMSRPRRRLILASLERFEADALAEDMLRHASYWVWLGEFLHPHEYAKRFPKTARAFAIIRGQGPDGSPAPEFRSYYSRLEEQAASGNGAGFTQLLRERPGELGRRFDHALRLCTGDTDATSSLLSLFSERLPGISTPVLLALLGSLPGRSAPAAQRIFWPSGAVSRGVYAEDRRPALDATLVQSSTAAIEAELLRRFAQGQPFDTWIVDSQLADLVAPFNERAASPAALNLPRGSRLPVPEGKVVRLFLHWCQPPVEKSMTDLDLSVGFYDKDWKYKGVCSYYQLIFAQSSDKVATSSGDLRNAPPPDGSSEFIDLDLALARRHSLRYAVMVVNAYAGLPFDLLERAFAGVMLREQREGKHFDPLTVALRFNLRGSNGVYLPLVLDLEEMQLHWLDVYSKGQFAFNNVASSSKTISTICPQQIDYFRRGSRVSMFQLALLQAAARGRQVLLRGADGQGFTRRAGESAIEYLARIRGGMADTNAPEIAAAALAGPCFAALYRGDFELAPGSQCYALFNERATATLEASALIS